MPRTLSKNSIVSNEKNRTPDPVPFWFGNFDPSLSQVSYANSSLIYSSNWSAINLLVTQQRTEPYKLEKLLTDAASIIKNAKGDCAKLLGANALARFEELKKRFQYDPSGRNLSTPQSAATTWPDSGNVYLDPWHYVFNPGSRSILEMPRDADKKTKESLKARNSIPEFWANEIKKTGVTEYSYAVGAILHEFLHQIGKFTPHTAGTRDSVRDQAEVVKKCIKGNEPKP
jgi:hypothetical protein